MDRDKKSIGIEKYKQCRSNENGIKWIEKQSIDQTGADFIEIKPLFQKNA